MHSVWLQLSVVGFTLALVFNVGLALALDFNCGLTWTFAVGLGISV